MHGPFDRAPKGEPNIYRNWSMKLFALPLLLVIALIGYVVSHPEVARRVVESVQAELAGTAAAPDSSHPTPAVQPTNQIHTITAR